MSTNTTSTNNGTSNGASRPKAGASKAAAPDAEGARYYPFGAIPLPDPATLERLANEFFLSMPKDLANGHSAEESVSSPDLLSDTLESEEIPTVMFTEEMLPLQRAPMFESSPSIPASAPSSPPGPLTESDLRAIAASLAGSTALVPGAPGTAPAPPVAGSPPGFFVEGNISPLTVAPKLPTGNELFSFPGIVAAPSSPPTSPPGGADMSALPQSPGSVPTVPGSAPYFVEGEKGTSPAAASLLPPISELFSFPRVPAMPNLPGIETIPNAPAPPVSPSAAPPDATMTTATGVAQPHDVKSLTPAVPANTAPELRGISSTSSSGSTEAFAEVGKTVYPGAASSLPSLSELFSFPGVPGMQSAPGVPAFPTSMPSAPSTEADLRTATPLPVVPASGIITATEVAPSPLNPQKGAETSPATSRLEALEFRPNLVPLDLGTSKRPLDANLVRRDFPILEERVHGRPLIWLDNAAT